MAAERIPASEDVVAEVLAGGRFKAALRRVVPRRMTPLVALRILGAVAAVALFVYVIYRLGPEEILAQLVAAGPGFVWILLLHVFAIAIHGVPWHVLLPRQARPALRESIASRFVASGANAIVPVVAAAGDVVRLWWLPRREDHAAGVAAIVVDRLMYVAANAVLVLAAAAALARMSDLPAEYTRATLIGVVVLVLAVAIGIVVAAKLRLVGRIHALVNRVRKREEDPVFGHAVDVHVEEMLRRKPGALVLAFACHLIAKLAIGAQIVIGFALLGVHLDVNEALVFAALPIVMGIAGALVPSQLGVTEGAQALLAASLGIPSTTAVAVVLLMRVRSVAGLLIIGAIIATKRSAVRVPPVP